MTSTMLAAVVHEHGGPDRIVLEPRWPRPEPGPGWVQLRVRACSLNYHDIFTRRSMPGIKVPLPIIIGSDIAGEISALGEGVSGWSVGERVLVDPLPTGQGPKGMIGEMYDGGRAEYCLAWAPNLIRIPQGVSFEQAASLPLAYATAHRMMTTIGQVRAGETVLVLGASGGVGTGCVLLAKMLGAEVIACASSEDKIQRLKDLGADHVINYRTSDFSKWAVEKFGKPQRRSYEGGVDVVINFTGGDTWAPSLKCVKRGGKILVCGATAGYDPKEDLRYVWSFEIQIIGSNSFYDENLKALMDLIEEGRMKPVIDEVLPLEKAAEGLKLIENREVFGKVVIIP